MSEAQMKSIGGAVTPLSDAQLHAQGLQESKAALRETILARRDAADEASRRESARIVTRRLAAMPAYRSAKLIAAYASFGSELDTAEFLAMALADGRQLLLPRINRARRILELRAVNNLDADLVTGVWGIREPSERCPVMPLDHIDFMLVPGVAFTAQGARLGYGGGFYDRLLALLDRRVVRVAAAFDLQLVDHLPEASHDQRVDQIMTRTQELHCVTT